MTSFKRGPILAVISGPDGCGKSFIIHALSCKNLDFVHFHIWPRAHRVSKPMRRELLSGKPYGLTFSLLKFFFIISKFWLLYLYQRCVKRSNIFIFDRYLDEFNLNPQRYKISETMAKYLNARLFLPKPHYRFLVVAPTDMILKKGELTENEVESFYWTYRKRFPESIEVTNETGTDFAPNAIFNILS